MVTPSPRTWRRLLVLAGLLATLLVPTAAAAEATATMTVRARVVDRCRIRLPDWVPPHPDVGLPDHVGDLVEHRCRRPVRPRITTSRRDQRDGPSGVAWQRHDDRSHVLVTLTY